MAAVKAKPHLTKRSQKPAHHERWVGMHKQASTEIPRRMNSTNIFTSKGDDFDNLGLSIASFISACNIFGGPARLKAGYIEGMRKLKVNIWGISTIEYLSQVSMTL